MKKEEKMAFEEYFELYYQQAFKYTIKKVSDMAIAEDLVMDAFASCHQKFEEFDPERAKFATWLYVVLNNKIKNYYRDKKELVLLETYLELAVNTEDDILTAIHIGQLRELLAEALMHLPEVQRKIVVMKYFKGKDSKEIASACGLTSGNVRVQMARAMKKLKLYFEKSGMEW